MAGQQLRLDALIRVSRRGGREGEEFRSPAQQREVCQTWADRNRAKIVAWHEAIDVSGKTMARPDIDAARARIQEGRTEGVIIAWLDRFSRAPVAEAMTVHDEITRSGGRVVACDMAGVDASDPTGEWMLTAMLATNRMQWRRLAERWEMSRRDAIRGGRAMGGAPFGYVFTDPTPRGSKGVVDSRLLPDPEKATIVRELFERKAGGETWLELARWMDEVAPRPNGRAWQRSTITGMIKTRTYLGELRHGKFVNPNAHVGIVPPVLWRQAQNPPGRRTPRGTYLLSGLVRCSGCSRRMHASSGGVRKPAVFSCVNARCDLRYLTVSIAPLDREVTRQFFDRLGTFHVQAVDDKSLESASALVAKLEDGVQRLAQVIPTHPKAIEAHQAALADAEAELVAAEDHLHDLRGTATGPVSLDNLAEAWETMTLDERREVIRSTIDCILVRRSSGSGPASVTKDRILVLFRGSAPAKLMNGSRDDGGRWAWDDDVGSLRPTA